MKLESIKRNQLVELTIPSARPIRLQSGILHEAGQTYKVLGTHGTLVRLSRLGDNAKLMVVADDLVEVTEAKPLVNPAYTPISRTVKELAEKKDLVTWSATSIPKAELVADAEKMIAGLERVKSEASLALAAVGKRALAQALTNDSGNKQLADVVLWLGGVKIGWM